MKKRIIYIFILLIFMAFCQKVKAMSVSKNNLTIEKGKSESIELYANTEVEVKSVTFTMVFSTYDIPAAFVVNNAYNDSNPYAITHTITFPEPKSGKILIGRIDINVVNYPNVTAGNVSVHSAKATTTDDNTITLNNQEVNITIGTPQPEAPKVIDKNMLDKIESKLVTIELQKDIFEYSVTIDSTVEELDLKPVAKDTDTKVEITTQKISEIKDNKIVITTKKSDTEQKYTISLNIKEEETTDTITVGETEYKANTSYKAKWIILSVVMILILAGSLLSLKRK